MGNYLDDSATDALKLSPKERIEYVRSHPWVNYPRAAQIRMKLEELLAYPKTHRMPNMLIVGETNNGKTMIVKRFCAKHKEFERPDKEGISIPVFYIQAPPTPNETAFYTGILSGLGAPFSATSRRDRLRDQSLHLLDFVGTKVLIIDEIQHVLAGSLNAQRAFLNVIKYIGNELQIPIVAAGIPEAFRALQTDPQLANRFEPEVLPRWEMTQEYLSLLASFERTIPLGEESMVYKKESAFKILTMTEGLIGEIARLLEKAAVLAIETGEERITAKLLDEIEWTSPSNRKGALLNKRTVKNQKTSSPTPAPE